VSGLGIALPDWPVEPLGSVLVSPEDLTYGIVQPGPAVAGGIPIVRVSNVQDGRIDTADPLFVDPAVEAAYSRSRLTGGELLITLVGTAGEVAIAPGSLTGWNTARAIGVARIRPQIGAQWVALCLRSREAKARIASRLNTTVQPTLNLKDLREVPIPLPPDLVRRGIAATLGALDDKIDSNRRVITTARQLARQHYLAGLADATVLGVVAESSTFLNRQRVPLSAKQRSEMPGTVPYYGATGVFGHVAEPIFDQVLVLVGEDGSVVNPDGSPVVQYIWGPSWVNNHAHVLVGRQISTELLMVALEDTDVRPIVTGAVQAKISMSNLKAHQIRLPAAHQLERVESALASLFAVVRARTDEIGTLTSLRDILLPELLSGRIRVPEAREAFAESG